VIVQKQQQYGDGMVVVVAASDALMKQKKHFGQNDWLSALPPLNSSKPTALV